MGWHSPGDSQFQKRKKKNCICSRFHLLSRSQHYQSCFSGHALFSLFTDKLINGVPLYCFLQGKPRKLPLLCTASFLNWLGWDAYLGVSGSVQQTSKTNCEMKLTNKCPACHHLCSTKKAHRNKKRSCGRMQFMQNDDANKERWICDWPSLTVSIYSHCNEKEKLGREPLEKKMTTPQEFNIIHRFNAGLLFSKVSIIFLQLCIVKSMAFLPI